MSSQIRRSGSAPDHQSASAPSASSSGQPANPASAAKARIPSAIKWNPQQTVTPDGKRPPFIGLAHEMIHARHNLKGESGTHSAHERLRNGGHASATPWHF